MALYYTDQAVIVPAVIPCGHCDACRRGKGTICPNQKMPGNDIHGGFATHIIVPSHGLCVVDEHRLPAGLEPQFASHILGAQAQLWTEYLEGPKNVEYMAYPRMCALAEVLWTPRDRRDFADFSARLPRHLDRLQVLDVNYRR